MISFQDPVIYLSINTSAIFFTIKAENVIVRSINNMHHAVYFIWILITYKYTQATSICLIQSEVTELNSRKTTKRNSELFPSCLTQEVGSVTRSQRASVLSSQTLLAILNVEPLYLRIVAAPEN